jgi:NADH-quinone oxidoreductase subunit G
MLSVTTSAGTVTLPLALADLPDRVVWLPTNSGGNSTRRDLGAGVGAVVTIAAAGPVDAEHRDETSIGGTA